MSQDRRRADQRVPDRVVSIGLRLTDGKEAVSFNGEIR